MGNGSVGTAVRIIISIVAFTLLASCSNPREKDGHQDPREMDYIREYQRGSLDLKIVVDRQEITIAERCDLTFEVILLEQYELTMPALSPDIIDFGIVDYRDGKPELLDGGRVAYRRSYTLEPFLSGEYTIPELTFRFKKRDDSEAAHELVTEPVVVIVQSLLPEDVEELILRDVSAPAVPPRGRSTALLASIIGGAVIVAATAVFVVMRIRGKRGEVILYAPAHEIAVDALEQLIADDLLGRGETGLFYVRISDILRHYIEHRFGIRAPEQTTEEFLSIAGSGSLLSDSQRAILRRFLTHCDMVKFADHSPERREIQETFDTCKDFIESTRDDRVTVAMKEGVAT